MEFDPIEYAEMLDGRKKNSIKKQRATRLESGQSAESGEGSLFYNGMEVDGGDNLLKIKGKDSTQLASAGTEHLTRGRVPGNPERRAEGLEYDGVRKQWYRVVRGLRVYE